MAQVKEDFKVYQNDCATATFKKLVSQINMMDPDRASILAFLSGSSEYAPASVKIVGIFKTIRDEMSKDSADTTAVEKAAVASYGEFKIERGTKQWDPVSKALFIAVLEVCMRQTKRRWRSCGSNWRPCGFLIKNQEDTITETNWCKNNQYLTNLRFADDLLIVAKSKEELSRMMSVLKEECSKVGLEMHTQKTQVLTNGIKETIDNRKENIGSFKEKIYEAKKGTLARQQKRRDKRDTKKGVHKDAIRIKKDHKGKDGIALKEHTITGDKGWNNTRKGNTTAKRNILDPKGK